MSMYLVLPLIQAVSCLMLTVTVLIMRFRNYPYRIFSFFLLLLVTWGFLIYGMRSSPDTVAAFHWERWLVPLALLMGVVYYHFSLLLTTVNYRRWIIRALYLLFLISIPLAYKGYLVSEVINKSYGFAPKFMPAGMVVVALVLFLGALSAKNWWRVFRSSRYPIEKNRAAFVLIAICILTAGGLFDAMPLIGLPSYPGLVISIIVFCIVTTVAITKYNLLDVRVFARKSIIYILTSAAMAVPVIVTFLMATYLLSESPMAPWLYLLLVIVLAFTLPPLWKVIQKQVDRWFFRDRYNYLKALETFGWHSQSLSDISEVSETTVKMLAGALRASNVYLLFPPPKNRDFQLVCDASGSGKDSGLVIGEQSPILRWLEHTSGLLRFSDISIIPQLQNVTSEEQALMEKTGIDLIVPLKIRGGKLSGLVLLGKKLDGQPYSVEDIQLLAALGGPIAVTLENMRLYRDILESRENLETWLNSMSDPVIIVDANLSVQFMNQAAIQSLGDYSGGKCWQLLERNNMCLDCPVFGVPIEYRGSPKHIGTRAIGNAEYEVATAPLLNPDGSRSIIEVFRDVTERNRLEKEIIQAQVKIEALKQSEQLKTDLLSMVSHELRTPLAVIKGQITSLLRYARKWKDPEKIDFLRDIDQATDSLTRLVGNLLDMSILDAGAMKLEKDYYQISEILEWAAKSLKIATRGHVLEIKLPPDLPAVPVDRTRIGQVLINLCENAAKYSDAGSHIYIEAESDNNQVRVSVIDEGEGIMPEDRERVFEKFFRVANNYSSAGIGLGLAICRGIIKAHGGQIYVESANGKGSKFVFSLPVNENRSIP